MGRSWSEGPETMLYSFGLGAAVDVCQLVDSAERFIIVSKSVHDFVLKTLLYVRLECRFTGWDQAT